MDDIKVTPKVSEHALNEESGEESLVSYPSNSDMAEQSLIKIDLANQLGVRDTDDHRFNFIFESLSKDTSSKGEIIEKMRNIEKMMGLPRYGLGESRMGLLYNYLKAQSVLDSAVRVRNSYLA